MRQFTSVLTVLAGVFCLILGAGCCAPVNDQEPAKPLNVVFVLADDFGWMDIGANNPDCFHETPNLDRLAATGMNFTSGYAANPVCSPTRFSIMTGKYPTRAGATDWFSGARKGRFNHAVLHDKMPLEEVTLAEALKEHGYRTAFLGKWHLGEAAEYWPEHQGFEINVGGWASGSPKGGYFAPFTNPRLAEYPEGTHLPQALTEEALRIMDQFQNDPFLLYLSFYSVHTPLQGREDLVKKYEAKRKLWMTEGTAEFAAEEQVWPTDQRRRVRIRQSHAVYAAMVEAMDEQIGRLLDHLEALGIEDHTAVIFMSDNGGLSTAEGSPTSNLPLRGGKGWLYEGGVREPFIIRWPGHTQPGSTCDVPVISTDFYPTLLDMAGLPAKPEQTLDGISLVPVLKGGRSLEREELFWHYPHYSNQGGFPGACIRRGDWKLLERFEDGRIQLFNLADDIGEQNDLATVEPERMKAMRDRLHFWYKETDARFLRPLDGGPEPWRPE